MIETATLLTEVMLHVNNSGEWTQEGVEHRSNKLQMFLLSSEGNYSKNGSTTAVHGILNRN